MSLWDSSGDRRISSFKHARPYPQTGVLKGRGPQENSFEAQNTTQIRLLRDLELRAQEHRDSLYRLSRLAKA